MPLSVVRKLACPKVKVVAQVLNFTEEVQGEAGEKTQKIWFSFYSWSSEPSTAQRLPVFRDVFALSEARVSTSAGHGADLSRGYRQSLIRAWCILREGGCYRGTVTAWYHQKNTKNAEEYVR